MKLYIVLIVVLAGFIGISIIAEHNALPNEHMHENESAATDKKNTTPATPSVEKAVFEPGDIALVKTNRGNFKFVIFERDMPVTSKNFCELAKSGFYKGLKFHRVEKWVVQGGDPKGDGTGGSEKKIKLEMKKGLGFQVAYMVGMARTNDPDSASSQFFVTKLPAAQIQTIGYACFGIVYEGSDVINKIKKGDRIKDVLISYPTANDMDEIKTCINKLMKASAGTLSVSPSNSAGTPDNHSHK
ncbi:MAG: peptidylprolyl isomerase [Armatimonadota bacterium]